AQNLLGYVAAVAVLEAAPPGELVHQRGVEPDEMAPRLLVAHVAQPHQQTGASHRRLHHTSPSSDRPSEIHLAGEANLSRSGDSAKEKRRPARSRVGVATVGGIFVHKGGGSPFGDKPTSLVREAPLRPPLPPEQEARAQALAAASARADHEDWLRIARD